MRKLMLFVIPISILILSCGQNKNEKNQLSNEKPIQNFLSYRIIGIEFKEFDIDTLANFREILDVIEEIDCVKNYALFKLETDKEVFKIQPLHFCDAIFDYKLSEIIYINTDSITVNFQLKYPIDSLKMVLNNHLLNKNNDENYPSTEEKKLISINVDSTKNILETKNLLLQIISDINEINTKTNFWFLFEDIGIIHVIEE